MGGWGFFLGGKGGVTAGEIQTWDLEVQVEKRGGGVLNHDDTPGYTFIRV